MVLAHLHEDERLPRPIVLTVRRCQYDHPGRGELGHRPFKCRQSRRIQAFHDLDNGQSEKIFEKKRHVFGSAALYISRQTFFAAWAFVGAFASKFEFSMADVRLRSIIRHLRRTLGSLTEVSSLSDTQLVQAFVYDRDEGAVEILVWRHGTMVLNLCRRILNDEHQAEDAFQATFLVFVRKAGSIGKRQSVGSWLYKVASRVAYQLRRKSAKQPEQRTAAELSELPGRGLADDLIWRDLRPVLDEEINRLPEKFRSPIVLCYLQGRTNDEAARLLGCPKETIRKRLWRAREALRSRLARRGLTLSAGWLATHLSVHASSAAARVALADLRSRPRSSSPQGKRQADSCRVPLPLLHKEFCALCSLPG